VGAGQAPAVELILAQNGYENILTHQDTQGIWRVVEGTVNH
jgi:release factor glutamine methyltransferase